MQNRDADASGEWLVTISVAKGGQHQTSHTKVFVVVLVLIDKK